MSIFTRNPKTLTQMNLAPKSCAPTMAMIKREDDVLGKEGSILSRQLFALRQQINAGRISKEMYIRDKVCCEWLFMHPHNKGLPQITGKHGKAILIPHKEVMRIVQVVNESIRHEDAVRIPAELWYD